MENKKILITTKSTALILLLLLLHFSLLYQITTAYLTDQELNAALTALRSHGYTLFPNAITTSVLLQTLLQSRSATSAPSSFTLFAPPDSLLFSLDLSSAAPHYIRSLNLHVSPSRLSTSDLRNLASGPYIDSLVPNHRLLINNSLAIVNGTVLDSVSVNRVRVSVPDLFLGSDIAVHGLQGILVAGFQESDLDLSLVEASQVLDSSGFSPVISPAPEMAVTAVESRLRRPRYGGRRGHGQRGGRFHGGHGG